MKVLASSPAKEAAQGGGGASACERFTLYRSRRLRTCRSETEAGWDEGANAPEPQPGVLPACGSLRISQRNSGNDIALFSAHSSTNDTSNEQRQHRRLRALLFPSPSS